MVTINNLYIAKDGTSLTIQATSSDGNFTKIILENQDSYIVTGPTTNPKYSADLSSDSINLTIPSSDITDGLSNFIIVYLYVNNLLNTIIGVYNKYPFYIDAVSKIQGFQFSGKVPKEFIDSILVQEALDLFIETGDIPSAISLWDKYDINNNKSINYGYSD